MSTLAVLTLLAQADTPGEDGSAIQGLLIILAVLVLIVLVIGGVWTFAAKRGSRTPERRPDDESPSG